MILPFVSTIAMWILDAPSLETDGGWPAMPNTKISVSLLKRSGRALRNSTPEQRGFAVASLLAFVGVAYLGPMMTRLATPKTRAQRLRDEAAFQAEAFRRRARKTRAKMRKQARRLGGGAPGAR